MPSNAMIVSPKGSNRIIIISVGNLNIIPKTARLIMTKNSVRNGEPVVLFVSATIICPIILLVFMKKVGVAILSPRKECYE